MKRSTRTRVLSSATREVLTMARQAELRLRREVGVLNALNVFPVPDGDTGSNMLATVQEALTESQGAADLTTAVGGLARGALLGARGNSGVILSQLFRAQQEILEARDHEKRLEPGELHAVLARASELANKALANPTEGTMLSALNAVSRVPPAPAMGPYLESIVAAAEDAVAATPDQLAILREAGVVDSGAYGLLIALRGWYSVLAGGSPPQPRQPLLGLARARQWAAAGDAHPAKLLAHPAGCYGYCVTLLVDAPDANEDAVRSRLGELGDSVLAVAVGGQLKLHAHVPDPEPLLSLARGLGAISRSEISNIDEQTGVTGVQEVSIVAVASGDGLARVFQGLGARVVGGGQTHNPSTADLLEAANGLPPPVFLLPNNGNVLAAARQAASARDGIFVVPTRSVPEGIAAVLSYDPQAVPEANLASMADAAKGVLVAELVTAARPAKLGGIHVNQGQTMVLLAGELLGVEQAGVAALAERAQAADPELATIYYGASGSAAEAQRLGSELQGTIPNLQIEVVRGDQPHASFILGFE